MPFLDKDKKPLVPKLEIPHKPTPQDKSLFQGKSKVYEGGWGGVEKTLKRDPIVRRDVERILRTGDPLKRVTPDQIGQEIKKLEGRVDLNKDKSFTPNEVKWAMKKESWKEVEEKKKANMLDYKQRSEVEKRRKEDELLKKKFGVK